MKKPTYSQGKLLIKLIDRETHSSGYELINAFLGPVRAGFYQAFAWVFGASLKKRYDPMGADRLTERIVLQVEAGQLYYCRCLDISMDKAPTMLLSNSSRWKQRLCLVV